MNSRRSTLWVASTALLLLIGGYLTGMLVQTRVFSPFVGWLVGGLVLLAAAGWSAWAVGLLPRSAGMWWAFGYALTGCSAVLLAEWFRTLPWVGELWARGDPARYILVAVVVVAWWVLLSLGQRRRFGGRERRFVEQVRAWRASGQATRESLVLQLTRWEGGSLIRQRVEALLASGTSREHTSWRASEQAGVDTARLHSDYGPLRALVWTLPALGFLGTAAAMASSIAGVGAAVDPTATDQPSPLARIVPSLADAFGLTLVALTAAIVCHFVLSATLAAEERVLLDGNEVILDTLDHLRLADRTDEGTGVALPTGNIAGLEQQLLRLNVQVERLMNGRGYSETLSTYLYAVVTQLTLLNESHQRLAGQLNRTTPATGHDRPTQQALEQLHVQIAELCRLLRASPLPFAQSGGES